MNATRTKFHWAKGIAAILFVASISACNAPQPSLKPMVLDGSKPLEAVTKELGETIDEISKATRLLAPELVASAEAYVKLATQAATPEEQKRLLFIADACARNAETVAATRASSRTIHFPSDRSIGKVSTSKDNMNWKEIGPAQGNLDIEAETALMVNLNSSTIVEDIRLLAAMPPGSIQHLVISSQSVPSEVYEALPNIVGLQKMSLYGTDCNDAMLSFVAQCYGLAHLNLLATLVTDEGMRALLTLPALREIGVGDTSVGDRGVFLIAQLPALESIILKQNRVSDVSVDYLRKVPGLKRLWIGGPLITDKALALLAELKQLKELTLLNTNVSERALRTLGDALPECKLDAV